MHVRRQCGNIADHSQNWAWDDASLSLKNMRFIVGYIVNYFFGYVNVFFRNRKL